MLEATNALLTGAACHWEGANNPQQCDDVRKVIAVTLEDSINWLAWHLFLCSFMCVSIAQSINDVRETWCLTDKKVI